MGVCELKHVKDGIYVFRPSALHFPVVLLEKQFKNCSGKCVKEDALVGRCRVIGRAGLWVRIGR